MNAPVRARPCRLRGEPLRKCSRRIGASATDRLVTSQPHCEHGALQQLVRLDGRHKCATLSPTLSPRGCVADREEHVRLVEARSAINNACSACRSAPEIQPRVRGF